MGFPAPQGLYDARNEHDSCGVGFVAHIKGAKSHGIVTQALEILKNLDHRGAVGADPLLGDGAGILIQMPDRLFRRWAAAEGKERAIMRWRCASCRGTGPRANSSARPSRSSSPRKASD
jgi:glutamate synthase (NADPH) large chain